MLRRVVILFLTLVGFSSSYAQIDSATVYRFGLPVTEDDTATNFPSYDYAPKADSVFISASELPNRLLKTLRKDDFIGWEKFPVYQLKATGVYMVRVRKDNDVVTYGFNEFGKPVSYGMRTHDD
jgi:hypothetical protein